MKTNYEEMFPHEFEAAINANPIVYLPLGALEYHGHHNALGLDSLKAWKICELAAEKIGGVVLPPLYFGVDLWPNDDLDQFPNKYFDCYHVDDKTYLSVLESYYFRMIKIGFKKIVVLAGHYPNFEIAQTAAEKFKDKAKFVIVREPDLVEGEKGDHAGKWETSLLMASYPELVDLKLMEGKENRLMAVQGEDPANSTPEYGKELMNKMVAKIEDLLKQ